MDVNDFPVNEMVDRSNYENTILQSEDFPFNCFYIVQSETYPHWHSHLELILIQSGHCDVYINGDIFSCNEGDFIFVLPNTLHSIQPYKDSSYYALVFGDTLFNDLLLDYHCKQYMNPFVNGNSLITCSITTSTPYYSTFSLLLNEIIQEFSNKSIGYELLIKLDALKLLMLIGRTNPDALLPRTQKQETNNQLMIHVIQYLSIHYKDKLTILDMSRYTNMSMQHFCRTFKAYTGKTFVEFLTFTRLEKAHQLLLSTDIPISQIPELTGFCNTTYFSRVFKQRYGIPPTLARKGGVAQRTVDGR